MTSRIGYIVDALAHSLYTRNSLDPRDTEAWKILLFEPTPATTVAPSPSESRDITTAPLRLLKKNKFHGTVLCLISLTDPSNSIYFWCANKNIK